MGRGTARHFVQQANYFGCVGQRNEQLTIYDGNTARDAILNKIQ